MVDTELPPGLVLWPNEAGLDRRIAVLISDIHCTDGSVGKQTVDETDWEKFFRELGEMLDDHITDREVLLILNGDVVDLLRSGKWAEANVYPWQRDDPRFTEIIMSIMRDIVKTHALSSGFFFSLQKMVSYLKDKSLRVTLVPTVGNHDKELQVVPEAREMYYRDCLGLSADDLGTSYRKWVAAQMGSDPDAAWPLLPFYVADPRLRLFATHGQWRDSTNSSATRLWKFCKGWQPQIWQKEQYRAFSDPCFGDTIASGLLSHFIWNATNAIKQEVIPLADEKAQYEKINHILNVLNEMDLYRPSAQAVVCLLEEVTTIDQREGNARLLRQTVINQYRNSLQSWLACPETSRTAPVLFVFVLPVISFLSRLKLDWLDIFLMRLMAWASDIKGATPFAKLPAFLKHYRKLGFRVQAEGHTHVTMDVDLRYSPPRERRNYTYVNLGAWRNRIVLKYENKGYRRLSAGRAMIVHGSASSGTAEDAYWFTLRDFIGRGDKLDRW